MSTTTAPAPTLTAAELAHFHDHGYVVKRQLFTPAEIKALECQVEQLHEKMAEVTREDLHVAWEENLAEGRRRIRQLMHSERVCPLIDAMSRSDTMLAIVRQLIGPDLYLFHSKLMMKSAQDGSFTPWHQDFQYWQYESKMPTQVNCMLFIDRSLAANGALRFVEGSHKGGLLPAKRFAAQSFGIGIDGDLNAFPEAVMIEMEPGDAVFFGALVIHGSGPNTSPMHRRANTFAFDAPGNRLEGELRDENWRCGHLG